MTGIGLGVGRLLREQDIARFDTLIPDVTLIRFVPGLAVTNPKRGISSGGNPGCAATTT
jgi:hypothetical protein